MSKPMVYAIPLMLPGCSLFPTTDIECQQSGRCTSQLDTMPKDLGTDSSPDLPILGADLGPARWVPVFNTSDKLNAIHGAEQPSASSFFIGASEGKVVRVTGGSYSTTQISGSTANVSGVHCESVSTVYVVDEAGGIYSTTNGGSTYAAEKVKSISSLYTVTGKGKETVTVGADVKYGFYNGNAWGSFLHGVGETQYASWTSNAYWYIAGADGSVAKSAGPGTTAWTLMSISGAREDLRGLWGTSDNNLWTVGEAGRIARYNGSSWTKMDQGTNKLSAIWGSASNDIWAVGDKGSIYHYNGNSWQAKSSATTSGHDLTGVWGDSKGSVWAIGNNASGGAIFKY